MRSIIPVPYRQVYGISESQASSRTKGTSVVDVSCSEPDSDGSDCTCDSENVAQEEDSGRFSIDFSSSVGTSPLPSASLFPTRFRVGDASGQPEASDPTSNQGQSPKHKKYILGENEASCPRKIETTRLPPNDENRTKLGSSLTDAERTPATTHGASEIPICKSCLRREKRLFNTDCGSCWSFFRMKDATPSHVFAILRIWIPQVQKNIENLVKMALLLGCHVADRDDVTDMTLLHYAVKAGTHGIGDPLAALRVVSSLIKRGADPRERCKWTSMSALHYAAYFDVHEVLEFILACPEGVPIDERCSEYDDGTSLHIAAANLSEGAFKVLLKHGACPWVRDNHGRTPQECLPSVGQFKQVPGLKEVILRMQQFLLHQRTNGSPSAEVDFGSIPEKEIFKGTGLRLGDRVLVAGTKTATLRYAGTIEFATGLWAGVELECPDGSHNGSLRGVFYFHCANNHGLFVPLNQVTKIPNLSPSGLFSPWKPPPVRPRAGLERGMRGTPGNQRRSSSLPPRRINHGKVDVSKVTSKVAQDIRNSERKIVLGDRVRINLGSEVMGVVRFTGTVHFASGFWIGIELDEPLGLNDGSVCGTRYFFCRRHHGIFTAPAKVAKMNEDNSACGLAKYQDQSSHSERSKRQTSFTNSSRSFSNSVLFEDEGVIPSGRASLALYPTNTSMSNLNRCFSGRYISSRKRQQELEKRKEEQLKEPHWLESSRITDTPIPPLSASRFLEVGQTVFYTNKFGVLRYIGRVHFAEGTWLGVELRQKSGRHDGVVRGQRYFACKRGHGIMVPPQKVTVHGLNGTQLLKNDQDDGGEEPSSNSLRLC